MSKDFRPGDLVEFAAGYRMGLGSGPKMDGLSGEREFCIVIEGDEEEVRLLAVTEVFEDVAYRGIPKQYFPRTFYADPKQVTLIRRGAKRKIETVWACARAMREPS